VCKSLKHICAQIINDDQGVTLASASSLGADFKRLSLKSGNLEAAGKVGELLADKATKLGLKEVVFDRGGCPYHGQVKALAEAAREKGLVF
jgi:large subunit ribosomal protein L18